MDLDLLGNTLELSVALSNTTIQANGSSFLERCSWVPGAKNGQKAVEGAEMDNRYAETEDLWMQGG